MRHLLTLCLLNISLMVFAFGCRIACGSFHYGSIVICENKCNRDNESIECAKTWQGNYEENVFTTSVQMRLWV
jgi:hypothetical protein